MASRRSARDLGPDDMVWDFFSRDRTESMADRVYAASNAGIAAVGMYVGAWTSIREDATELDALDEALDATGVVIANIETIRGWASPDRASESGLAAEALIWEIADRYEVRYLQAIGDYTGTIAEAGAGFGALCDRAADHGLLVGIEAVPSFTNIDTITLAAQIVEAADRPNGGHCFDAWHLVRSTNDLDELRRIDATKIIATQWNDGPIEPILPDDYYTDCLTTRVPPGDGEFALVDMVRILNDGGCTAPIGLEVPGTELWACSMDEAARRSAEGMRGVIAAASR